MIEINELTKYYGDFCAVNNINFNINKGEVLGLLGPNGAGKSTTLRMLTCYLEPSGGDIKVNGKSVKENQIEIKNSIGYLPESAPIYPDMLVFDYLSFVYDIRHTDKSNKLKKIKELSELCSLNSVMHKPVNELSKGYKQRVGLAHAMIGDPEILVLDEPTSGLDPNQIIEIRDIIKEIGKEKTVILSTHILSEAEATCDRVVIINKGKIAADGKIDELKKQAGSNYSLQLELTNCNVKEAKTEFEKLPSVKELNTFTNEDGNAVITLFFETKEDLRGEVYNIVKNKPWGLVEFVRERKSLENIFRELTKEN